MPHRNVSKPVLSDYLGNTEGLTKREGNDNLPLYVKFQYHPEYAKEQIATDEAEVFIAYSDGFGVIGAVGSLPKKWQLAPADPQGYAMFKVPVDACIDRTHRKLRRRRYHNDVRTRKAA